MSMNNNYNKERIELAAAFRWTARLNMHESIANHFSMAVSEDGSQFLVNPNGRYFSQIKASELLLLDSQDNSTMSRPNAPDPTAWAIHSAIHKNNPQARCILHVHPKYATILAALADSTMYPIEQNTMRFFNRVSIDEDFDGMGLGDEAERLSKTLGKNSVLLLGNHGVLVASHSVAQAFDDLYHYERACQTLIGAYQTGKKLRVVSDEIAEKTAQQWQGFGGFANHHFGELMAILDKEEPDYKC
jgi:ribulose-5-phosphate 4-epimerase/fuculose-1-phosphate aldolase